VFDHPPPSVVTETSLNLVRRIANFGQLSGYVIPIAGKRFALLVGAHTIDTADAA
jgi:hypothetical protein